MNVLVLGGSYFVGRHVALRFAEAGASWVTLLNRGTRHMPFPTLRADRHDPAAMRKVLQDTRFDVVVDTSCYDAVQALIATQALEGRYGRWVFLSSPAVYDDHASRPLTEQADAPGSEAWGDHGRRKAEAERILREACGARLTIVRPGYVYGPYNSMARETFLWARMLRRRPIFVPGDGSTRVSFVHAEDLAEAVRIIASTPATQGQTYNVAHPEQVSFEHWVSAAAKAAGIDARRVYVPRGSVGFSARDYFPLRDQELTLDVSRAREQLGFRPQHDIDSGLASTIGAYSRLSLESMARESSVDLELAVALDAG